MGDQDVVFDLAEARKRAQKYRDNIDAFWSNVEKSDGCWMWTGKRSGLYPMLYTATLGQIRAQRYSLAIRMGQPVPDSTYVRTTCETKDCVNPDHLEAIGWTETPEQKAELNRKSRYKKHFGLTIEEYDKRLAEQGGVCAICGKRPGNKRLAIDHDHKTFRVRGLLCTACNVGLGNFKDSPSLLTRAAKYLRHSDG